MGRVLRRALGGLLVGGLLATALAFYTYSPYLTMTMPTGPRTAAQPPPSRTPTASEPPGPAPTPSPENPDQPPDPGGRDPGIRLVATVGAGRVFDVKETVRLPEPVTTVTLVPLDLQAAPAKLRSARSSATRLTVRIGDRTVEPPRRTVDKRVVVPLGRAVDRFELSYRLHGTIRVNQMSSPGRAIGAVSPLVSRVSGDLPVAVSVHGPEVLNVSCVRPPPAAPEPCFDGRTPNVRVNRHLPHRNALVLVQLDLR